MLTSGNMATSHQDQQQANFRKQRLIVPFRIRNRNWIIGSNWTCCDNLVFFWFGSDMGQNIILELRSNMPLDQQLANRRSS